MCNCIRSCPGNSALRGQYEAQLLELLERPRPHGRAASFGGIIASLLGSVHAWFSAQRLEHGATARSLEVALVGAIERLLGQPA
ncbi:hypothetical protein PSH81_12570 [Pseudomonas sp. FP2335]|uniref:hypothetical protein n=1 Tax=Pseudomonas sp. FP2335 TaxID=2954092 RepID=UPI0027372814|nr:hypothetical protein [Pseudomonas sp. FP2335]WLH82065.1 hypothetical protein PSH81_12570 [Pseudomonas sp. FP2335]